MSHVFHRTPSPLVADRSQGCWVYDVDGNRYLDAAGGAIVTNIGHGSAAVAEALQSARVLDYVHPSVFTSKALEEYATALAPMVPVDDVRVFPTSGGAESVETAIKLARSYHHARGDASRDVVISRHQSYHGNTLGALDLSGRVPLREPYESWLGRFPKVPEVTEYRCPSPEHPNGCASWHASQLEAAIIEIGPQHVAAFIAEAIGGASLGAALPPAGYWEAISGVCRRYGVVLIVDEIMTGFGRTGRWWGIEPTEVRPDIIVSGKGAAGGYWPLGLCLASGEIHSVVANEGGFVHGFTFSHSPTGASVAQAVLQEIISNNLVAASAQSGQRLMELLQTSLGEFEVVGDIRGRGLLIGLEFVSDRETKQPFPRQDRFVERLTLAARKCGLLVYPSAGCADGVNGDSILLGPPFTVSNEEIEMIALRLSAALKEVTK